MAIKGKKKSGSRGSQARRRPAAAPRPAPAATRRKPPWYETAAGRVIAAVLVVLVIAGIGTIVGINRSNANEEKQRRERVENYENELTSISQSASTAIGQMAAISPAATPEQLETLEKDAQEWATEIETAATRAVAATPPEDVSNIHPHFQQAFNIYLTSARLLGDAAGAEGKAQADLLTRATEVRAHADGTFINAVAQLDDVLIDLGGDPSGLQPPSAAAAPPAGATEIPVDPGEGEGAGGQGDQGDQGGGEEPGSDEGG